MAGRRGRPPLNGGNNKSVTEEIEDDDFGEADEDDLPLRPLPSIPRQPRWDDGLPPLPYTKPLADMTEKEKQETYAAMKERKRLFSEREAAKYKVTADSPFYDLTKTPSEYTVDLSDTKVDEEPTKEPEPKVTVKEKEPKESKQMPKKADDIASMVGKELLNGYKAAAREIAVAQLDPATSPLSSVANTISAKTIGDLASQFPTVNMRIKRRNPGTMRWDIIPGPRGVDPKAIAEPGALEDLILNWSGGGEYDIELTAPGTKTAVPISFTIDAPSIPTPAFRGTSPAFPAGSPQDVIAKYAAQLPATSAAQQQHLQQQQIEQGGLLRLVEQMLAMQLAQTMGARQESAPSREVDDLRRQTLELQAQLRAVEDRARADKERMEMLQRMDEISRKVDNAAQSKADPIVSLLTALVPIAPALLSKGDNMMQAILAQQQQSSNTTLELFKAMNNRPEVEERFAALIGTMGNMSANTMAMITQAMQTGLLEKGGESPITQIISQVIGEAADVAKTVFASGALTGGGGSPEVQQPERPAAPLPSLPEPTHPFASLPAMSQTPTPAEVTAEAAEEYALESEDEDNASSEEENVQDQPEVEEQPIERNADNTYDLMRDAAFREILMRIRNNGDLRDIAVRLYRHGNVPDPTKGHPVAKAWFTDPQRAGRGLMGQLGIEPTRIEEIVTAIEALTQHLAEGKDIADYAPTRRIRENRRITATAATATPLGEHFDPATITRVPSTPPPPPVEETAQPPVVESVQPPVVETTVPPTVES